MTEVRQWALNANDTLPERALKLAEIAFMDFANDRGGLIQRAAFRIANAMAHYERLDKELINQIFEKAEGH